MSFKKIPSASLVNVILRNPFPQTFLMGTSEFLSFLENRGIRIRDADLERFEEQGLLYPIVRIVRPTFLWKKIKKVENGITKEYLQPLKKGEIFDGETVERYAAIGDITHDLYDYLQEGLLVFPSKSNFKPWKEYKDGRETTVLPFYHPYQAICVREILLSTVRLTLGDITELENDVLLKRIEILRKSVESGRKFLVKQLKEYEKRIRLLVSIQDRYLPFIRKKFVGKGGVDFYDYWNNWFEWTQKFDLHAIFSESGFTLEQLKRIRVRFVAKAGIDPLERWYILVHHIPYSKREKLKGDALLAQDYYEIADMLGHFLTDITGEKQLDPDDLSDIGHGRWKKDWYGRDVDYKSREVLQKVLTEYGINPQDKVLLIVEGQTEYETIPKIAEAMRFNFDQLGIRPFPLKGVGEVKPNKFKKLLELLECLSFNFTVPYVILDNDQNVERYLKKLESRNWIPHNQYRIWKKEFEEDNFSDEEVLQQVIQQAKQKGFDLPISPEMIEQERQAKQRDGKPILPLTKILGKLTKPFGYKIDKPELGKALGKILSERITNQKDYTPTTEIEREILKIVELARRF